MINRRQLLKGGLAGTSLFFAPAILTAKSETKPIFPNPDCESELKRIRLEKLKIFEKWKKIFPFNGISEDNALELAVQLENQVLWNEMVTDRTKTRNDYETRSDSQFKRVSIPLVYRTFVNRACKDLVSLQTMFGPCALVFWRDLTYHDWKSKLNSADLVAKTRRYKTIWGYEAAQDLRAVHGLDAESELTAILSSELSSETDREVITDIKNNAPQFTCYAKNPVSFIDGRFANITGYDYRTSEHYYNDKEWRQKPDKCTRDENNLFNNELVDVKKNLCWVVTSSEICKQIEQHKDFKPNLGREYYFGVHKIGHIHNWDVYGDPLFPTQQAVLGYKAGHYGTGYILSHYIPYAVTVLDPESFCPRKGLLVRYGKTLKNRNLYAQVTFK